ncbi:28S ribosomal protein S35, mitochondrial [Schistocerca nitens]|uniref:28S ribosomal protein S35, mitochondrial n=1 Tax=Schistocerca nitens TaxID=7011 RepID=UPI0021194BF7|nr:28S ribosomal protein S35, mitochondrial [Schistocerca nitens]
MAGFVRLCDNACPLLQARLAASEVCVFARRQHSQRQQTSTDDEFRVLNLVPKKEQTESRRKIVKPEVLPPRSNQLSPDADWSNVWVGPRSFHPAVVPLPVRQGYVEKGVVPGKYGNAELMKIPNFLHLTPPAVKKHCNALKKFCTPWPEELDSDEKIEQYFPLEVISSDYCHSSPTIRDPKARIVTIRVKVKNFSLDDHAKDKLQRLVQERYDAKTDVLTIAADRCPLKKQNYDYAMYLLTAVVHESVKFEDWEKEKTEADMEYYRWDTNLSRHSILKLLKWPNGDVEDINEDISSIPNVSEYRDAVSNIWNEGENENTLAKYKEITKKIFSLPDKHVVSVTA